MFRSRWARRLGSLSLFIIGILSTTFGQTTASQFNRDLLKEFRWRLVGPSSPAGRAWQVVGVESDPKTFYVCTAGGGLWKSTDNGTTLLPVFDNETSASTGKTVSPAGSVISRSCFS